MKSDMMSIATANRSSCEFRDQGNLFVEWNSCLTMRGTVGVNRFIKCRFVYLLKKALSDDQQTDPQ